ncbi:hypothetical protein AX16_002742 [Volvariella volvacea WC 439]|nr:hypothetical protein AX16_002742 [Volvariella volvacea WC 439]
MDFLTRLRELLDVEVPEEAACLLLCLRRLGGSRLARYPSFRDRDPSREAVAFGDPPEGDGSFISHHDEPVEQSSLSVEGSPPSARSGLSTTFASCFAQITMDAALHGAIKAGLHEEVAGWRRVDGALGGRGDLPVASSIDGLLRNSDLSALGRGEYGDMVVDLQVRGVLEKVRPGLEELVRGEKELSLWTPLSRSGKQAVEGLLSPCRHDGALIDPEIVEHITRLRIPLLYGKPNVLLHDLDGFRRDPNNEKRVRNIFQGSNHTFLVNTSGSGKTKLLLAGLLSNWGFYFTAMVDSSSLGSKDLYDTISQYLYDQPGFSPMLPKNSSSPEFQNALKSNREIATRVFNRVLLARLLVFHKFAQEMKRHQESCKTPVNSAFYKHHWLNLQLRPSILHPEIDDIFSTITKALLSASDAFIQRLLRTHLLKLEQTCSADLLTSPFQKSPSFYCVIDEAQYAASQHSEAFRSDKDGSPRPVLRELVRSWEGISQQWQTSSSGSKQNLCIVIAGTGVQKEVVDQAMSSAIMKESMYRWISDTGAFDCEEEQGKYLRKYLPKELVKSEAGQRLLQRAWHWLRGRHRFTAGFVAALLENGFQSPHSILNEYISHFSGFRPTDGEAFVKAEGSISIIIPSRHRFNFEKLKKNDAMLATIRKMALEYWMKSTSPASLGQDEISFVEYGFARFVDSQTQQIAVNEPLALLAATQHFIFSDSSVHKFFSDKVGSHSNEGLGNGFESYIAYGIQLAFAKKRRLSEVFTFHKHKPVWAGYMAELVAIHRRPSSSWGGTEGAYEIGPVSYPKSFCASATLGFNAKGVEETLSWLNHEKQAPICFPHRCMGPDMLFVLRLQDGSLIWVAVQAKFSNGVDSNGSKQLRKTMLEDAVKKVTPAHFFLDRNGQPYAPVMHPKLIEETFARLASLPSCSLHSMHSRAEVKSGGFSENPFPLLRVIASFPASPEIQRVLNQDPDDDQNARPSPLLSRTPSNWTESHSQSQHDTQNSAFSSFATSSTASPMGPGSHHPLATLNMDLLQKLTSDMSPTGFLENLSRNYMKGKGGKTSTILESTKSKVNITRGTKRGGGPDASIGANRKYKRRKVNVNLGGGTK